MGAAATLSSDTLTVSPGDETSCTVEVHNDGPLVDQFTVDVVGEAHDWMRPDPPVVNLLPQATARITVLVAPPRSPEISSGEASFAVRVASREDPEGSVVEEGTVQVLPFTDVRARLDPVSTTARRRGRYQLVVDNFSNHEVTGEVQVTDPEERLLVTARPSTVALPAGRATVLRLTARPQERFWRGADREHRFDTVLVLDSGEPLAVPGTFVQRALLPPWLLPALLAAAALITALVVLWFTLLRPSLVSEATAAAKKETAAVAAEVDEVKDRAASAEDIATAADDKAQQALDAAPPPGQVGEPGAGGAGGGTSLFGVARAGDVALDQPTSFRIEARAPAGSDERTATFPTQDDKPLDVTDIQLQNPNGDEGRLELRHGDGTVWLRFGLENFRDYDGHFMVPVRFPKGDKLVLALRCTVAGDGDQCRSAVTFSGRTSKE